MQIIVSSKWLLSLLAFATGIGLTRSHADGRLLRAARTHDREAFDNLMREHSTALRRFASRRLPAADVDDVLQETWVAAWERVSTLEEADRFRAWVFSICYHKVQDSWRRRHSWAVADLGGCAEQVGAYVPKEIAQIELRECLAAFWSACPPDHREVLRMYYADGLTLKEIGQILGRNLNTVKYQFYRAHELASSKLPDSEILLAEVLR